VSARNSEDPSGSRARLGLLGALVTLLFFGPGGTPFSTQVVQAATITVNSLGDELTTNAQCTLREAILNAESNLATYPDCGAGSGDDTINLPAGTIELALAGEDAVGLVGDLDINSNVHIVGNAGGTSIDANQLDRIFQVFPGSALTLEDLTIEGGSTAGSGGGIAGASLTLINTVVQDNVAGECGGGIFIGTGGSVLIEQGSVIRDNATLAFNGGGICAFDGSLTVDASTISGNDAIGIGSSGGGIAVGGTGNVDIVIRNGSVISDNHAGVDDPDVNETDDEYGNGGGIYFPFHAAAALTITDSTVTGNSAQGNTTANSGVDGGGIYA
jgi:CSLREA domain-containing protein